MLVKWGLIEWWLCSYWSHVQVAVLHTRLHVSLYQQCTISRWTDTAPADDPNLPQTAPQPVGEKLYVPSSAVKPEEIRETFLTLRNEGNSRRGGSGHKYVDWCCKTATNQLPTEVHQPLQPQLSRC